MVRQRDRWSEHVTNNEFPLAPMGFLASRSAHERPSVWPPIDLSGNIPKSYPKFRNPRKTFGNTPFCPPKYSIVRGVGVVPNFFRVWNPHIFVTQGLMTSFGTLGQYLKLPPFFAQKCHSAGGRGGPPNCFLIRILIFLLLGSPCKNLKPYDNPFLGFEQRHQQEKRKRKIPKIVVYLSCSACCTHFARTNFRQRRWGFSFLGLRTLDPFQEILSTFQFLRRKKT